MEQFENKDRGTALGTEYVANSDVNSGASAADADNIDHVYMPPLSASLRNINASPWEQATAGIIARESRANTYNDIAHPSHLFEIEQQRYYANNQAPWNNLNSTVQDVVGLESTPSSGADPSVFADELCAVRLNVRVSAEPELNTSTICYAVTAAPLPYEEKLIESEAVNENEQIELNSSQTDAQTNDKIPENDQPACDRLNTNINRSAPNSQVTVALEADKDEDPYEYVDDDDAIDDEATLAEDESANGLGDDGELDELRELSEISVEELRKRFGYGDAVGSPSVPATQSDDEEASDDKPRRRRRQRSKKVSAVVAESASFSSQPTNKFEQLLPVDKSFADVLAATNVPDDTETDTAVVVLMPLESTKLEQDDGDDDEDFGGADSFEEDDDDDDDDDDDKDYVPPQKPSEIRCGAAYQAVVPDSVIDADIDAHYAALAEIIYDFVQWKPETTDEELIVAYQMAAMKQFSLFSERGTCEVNKAISDLTPFIHHVHQNPPNHFEPFPDHEDLLYQLMKSANNLRVGLQRCYIERLPRQYSSLGWLDEESQRFEEALLRFPKNFRAIARHVKTRSVRECVFFYYERKRSARYERHSSSSTRAPTLSSLYMVSPTPPAAAGATGSSSAWNSGSGGANSSNIYSQRLRNANINVPFYRQQQQQGLLFGVDISYPSPSSSQQQRTSSSNDDSSNTWTTPRNSAGASSSRYCPYPAAPAAQQRRSSPASTFDNPSHRVIQQQYTGSSSQRQFQQHSSSPSSQRSNVQHHQHRPYLQPGLNPIHHSHEQPPPPPPNDAANNNNTMNYNAQLRLQQLQQQQRMTTNETMRIGQLSRNPIIIANNNAAAGRSVGGKFFAPSVPLTLSSLPPAVQHQQRLQLSSGFLSPNLSLAGTFGFGSRLQQNNNNLSSAFSTTSSNGSAGLVDAVFSSSVRPGIHQSASSLLIPTAALRTSPIVTGSKFFGAITPPQNNIVYAASNTMMTFASSSNADDANATTSGGRSRGGRRTPTFRASAGWLNTNNTQRSSSSPSAGAVVSDGDELLTSAAAVASGTCPAVVRGGTVGLFGVLPETGADTTDTTNRSSGFQ